MDLKSLLADLREQAQNIKTEADAEYFYKAITALRDVADARRKLFFQERMNQQSKQRSIDACDKAYGAMNEFIVDERGKSRLR
jgi:hypothetical protein